MESLGDMWTAQLQSKEPAFDWKHYTDEFLSDKMEIEKSAQAFIDNLKSNEILEGINSSIERGSNSLSIPVPWHVVGTAAMPEFQDWLLSQNIEMLVGRLTEDDGTGLDEVRFVFSFTPANRGN